MNHCTFCSNQAEKLFSNLNHDTGKLCIECYMKLHGSCGVCAQSFMPSTPKPDVTYNIQARFVGTGEKNFIVCDSCYDAIRNEFPQLFA